MDELTKRLLESLQEGETSESIDLSSDVYLTKFSLSEEQSNRPGVLCTVEGRGMGPFEEKNRNERIYPVEVATLGILESPYVKEMLENKILLGEPHHPKERGEIWIDQVSHCITDMWLSEDNKYLNVRADILDTPNGRIIKTLIDYGSVIGISARASGKTKKTKEGLVIIPEEYHFKTFDIVTNPGFAVARMTVLTEGVEESQTAFVSAVEKLLESTDLRTLKSVENIIEYCEDESVKKFLPELREKLQGADKSDFEDNSLMEEFVQDLSEFNSTIAKLKVRVKALTDEVEYWKSRVRESDSDRKEVVSEEIINLKRTLQCKEDTINSIHEEYLDVVGKLDESTESVQALTSRVEDLAESRRVAIGTIKKYREIANSKQEPQETVDEESDPDKDNSVPESVEDSIPVVRRPKKGIDSVVGQKQEGALNESATQNPRRISIIKNVGG